MSDYTHTQLATAIERARYPGSSIQPDFLVRDRDAHLDTLAAILNLHAPICGHGCEKPHSHGACGTCGPGQKPCPTVGIVIDALRKMGAI